MLKRLLRERLENKTSVIILLIITLLIGICIGYVIGYSCCVSDVVDIAQKFIEIDYQTVYDALTKYKTQIGNY